MKFIRRLRFLFSSQAPIEWVQKMDLRSDRTDGRRPLTVAELHATLSEAMARGLGGTPVEMELEYVEGQLCGFPVTGFTGATIEQAWWPYYKCGLGVRLRPSKGLVHVSNASLDEALRLDAMRGTIS